MKTLTRISLLIFLALNINSCTTAPVAPIPNPTPVPEVELPGQVVEEPPATVDEEESFKVASPKFVWAELASLKLDKFGQGLISTAPRDWSTYCKTPFANLSVHDRKQFYIMVLSKLVQFESSYNPRATYKEAFKDAKGEYVMSAGLVQMSVESGKGYGCRAMVTSDFLDVDVNLECFVKIANAWVPGDRLIYGTEMKSNGKLRYLGFGRYWGPFRNSHRKEIMAMASSLSFCK